MSRAVGRIFMVLCTSAKADQDERGRSWHADLSANGGWYGVGGEEGVSVTLGRSVRDNGTPNPCPFVWGKKYRVTIEPVDE